MKHVARFEPVAGVAGDAASLTTVERARHARLRDERDRAAYRAAHLLVRLCVADLVGGRPDSVEIAQRCASCGSDDHGAPHVVGRPELGVSLSHTRTHVAAVAAYGVCGIDVEGVPRQGFPRAALTATEADWVDASPDPARSFARLWARKEALVKAGALTLADAGSCDVLGGLPGFELSEWTAETVEGEGTVGALALNRSCWLVLPT